MQSGWKIASAYQFHCSKYTTSVKRGKVVTLFLVRTSDFAVLDVDNLHLMFCFISKYDLWKKVDGSNNLLFSLFCIADLFDILLPMLNIYQEFVRNHQYSLQVLANCKQNRDFDKLLKQYEANPACEGRMLETFLTYPMFQVFLLLQWFGACYKHYLYHLVSNTNGCCSSRLVVGCCWHPSVLRGKGRVRLWV